MSEKHEYAKALSALAALEHERVRLATRCKELERWINKHYPNDEIAEWNVRYVGRIEELEQLCRDMISDFGQYAVSDQNYQLGAMCDDYQQRMDALGLLEGEE